RPQRRQDPELRGTLLALRAVARRVQQLTAEERELAREIEQLTSKLAPQLLTQPGIGPLLAAQIVLAWSHRGRLASEAAFARLAGVAPIPASSGQTIRHRLGRGGGRALERAPHQTTPPPPGSPQSLPRPGRRSATGSTAAATDNSTAHSTRSSSPDAEHTDRPSTTS